MAAKKPAATITKDQDKQPAPSAPAADQATAQPTEKAASAATAAPAAQEMSSAEAAKDGAAVEALWIRSVPESFRRCGFRFNREGYGIALDALTDEQIETLVNEPNLVVSVTRVTAEDDAE